jgi:RecB family exonuclease
VITPRKTRLVRVAHLHEFRHAIVERAVQGAHSDAPPPLVVVPTRSAARQLTRLLDREPNGRGDGRAASALNRDGRPRHRANAVTRDELYDRLHERLDDAPRRLTALEREVMLQRSARQAAESVPDLWPGAQPAPGRERSGAEGPPRATETCGGEPHFSLRPGLVAEMLRFYDHLRRQSQHVDRFEELIHEALGDDDEDRGARRLRVQTTFLAAAFRGYERAVVASDGCDEHLLRDRLTVTAAADPVRHIIVTVPDWIADPDGLFAADFDLLARIPGLAALELIATDSMLGSGFHERIHEWWPGLEEVRAAGPPATGRDRSFVSRNRPEPVDAKPMIVTPPDAAPEELWWTFRDREEELVSIARQIKADRRNGIDITLDRRAVVFKTPLPYLYLAAEVFPAAGIPYQAYHALPLAVEPSAAALDLVLDAVGSRFTRTALISLLRSPHFFFSHGGAETASRSISALNSALSQRQYLGDVNRLHELAADWNQKDAEAMPSLQAALAAADELAPLIDARPASEQIARLQTFCETHLRRLTADDAEEPSSRDQFKHTGRGVPPAEATAVHDPFRERERRARAAIAHTLSSLVSVHAAHDDPLWTIEDLALAVRRALEDQTFEPDSSPVGVHLVDDQAARYGDFDDIAIVGLVEPDWPERPRRNIFYPPGLLRALGWPSEKDRHAAAGARFLELLASASRYTVVSTFTLDDDALVARSTELDEMPRARLATVAREPARDARVFLDEALSLEPLVLDLFQGPARAWANLRVSRSPAAAPQFHGQIGLVGQDGQDGREGRDGQEGRVGHVGCTGQLAQAPLVPHAPPHPHSPPDARARRDPLFTVSALETYLECPFKFFAQHVLKLQDEPDDEEVMDPKRQGRFIHEVFETFFKTWQQAGQRAITPDNLDRARALFTAVVDRALEQLPPPEAALERTRLLGSAAAAGLGEAVLRMEAERPVAVVERLLEHDLRGGFSFATVDGTRTIALRAKADRMDLLEDGTFRLIDYKLGWPPNRARALQLPIYSICAEQRLAGYRGHDWRLGEAVYVAFKGPRRVVPLSSSGPERMKAIAEAQQRLVETVDAVARAEFPPTPDDVWRCETCSFSSVCRKDYVGNV